MIETKRELRLPNNAGICRTIMLYGIIKGVLLGYEVVFQMSQLVDFRTFQKRNSLPNKGLTVILNQKEL
jgi:hypothetical protein